MRRRRQKALNDKYWEGWREGRRSATLAAAAGTFVHVGDPLCPCAHCKIPAATPEGGETSDG